MEENNNENVEPVVETNQEEVKVETAEVNNEEKNEPVVNEVQPIQENGPKKKKPIALIIIAVMVVVALIIALIFLLKPKGDSNKDNDNKNNNVIDTPSDIKSNYRMTGNSLEKFDLSFLKLENEEKNKVYSPLSIKYALQMLSEGSSGDTKEQIDAVIGEYETKKYENNDNMSFANAMFIRDIFKDEVKDEYKNMLKEKYGAEVINDPFENPNNINKWISDKTFGLIPDLIKDVSAKDFYLINALAIDMKWTNLIHCSSGSWKNVPCANEDKNGTYEVHYYHEKLENEDDEYGYISYPYTYEDEFSSINFNGKENIKGAKVLASFNRYDAVKTIGEDKIRDVVGKAYQEWLNSGEAYDDAEKDVNKYLDQYIKELNSNYGKAEKSSDYSLFVDDNVKVFAKDLQTYNGTTLQYIGIMPKKISLSEYVKNVSVEDINQLINSLKELKIENFKDGYATIIDGDIPFFKYEYELNLIEDLKKLGIINVFDGYKSDLSGMLKDGKGEFIEEAKHKATIEFSNEGIKASAVTAEGGMGNTGGGFNYLFEVPTERINITFDNPYLYLIRDKNSGEVWFIGTVYEPITK